MLRLILIFVLLTVLPSAAQNEGQAAQPPPPSGPRIERGVGGIVMIRGGKRPPPAAAKTEAEAEATKAEAAKAEAPKSASRASTSSSSYGVGGGRAPSPESVERESSNGDSKTVTSLRNLNGRRIPYLSEEEKVISKGGGQEVSERRTQRYDANGNPTQQELVRREVRTLRDGTVETVETLYVQNMNGRLEPAERRVERTKEQGETTTRTVTSESPSINGRFRPFVQERSVEKRQGEDSAQVETVRYQPDSQGRLQPTAREQTTMSKSGSTSTTETQVYEKTGFSDRMDLTSRTVGTMVEQADGSASEKIETYGFQTASGPSNVNANGRPRLQEVVQRETSVDANGVMRERTTVRARSTADPTRMDRPSVVERVSRPRADGETVETQVYEQSLNGRLTPTQVVVEERKK